MDLSQIYGWITENLVDQSLRELSQDLQRGLVQLWVRLCQPLEFLLSDAICFLTQADDGRFDSDRANPAEKAIGLVSDDLVNQRNLVLTKLHRFSGCHLQVIDVAAFDVFDLVDRDFNITRHGDVEDHQRSVGTLTHRLFNVGAGQQSVRSAGRRNQQVGFRQQVAELLENKCLSSIATRQFVCLFNRAVDDVDLAYAQFN